MMRRRSLAGIFVKEHQAETRKGEMCIRDRLSYFLDMSDAEIANVLNMVRRSVAYRRTSTLKLLKNLMGGENLSLIHI